MKDYFLKGVVSKLNDVKAICNRLDELINVVLSVGSLENIQVKRSIVCLLVFDYITLC